MNDPITFDPLGTVRVEFDDETYTLTRPKMGQWRYFSRRWSEAIKEAGSQLTELLTKLDAARALLEKSDNAKNRKAVADLSGEITGFNVQPLYEWNIPWIREVFEQLGDKPLPEDVDVWPAWLASDPALPNRIIGHWQAHPKASGENPK